ncbi:MAG: DUF1838 family protein [Sphingomonadaceae bacterium]|nr:DUF1838 family protein [Sphingomonadaceae bacterium]
MQRRSFLKSGLVAGAGLATAPALAQGKSKGSRYTGAPRSDAASLKGALLDLKTPQGNREAWARLLANTDMKSTKYGWAQGIVQGIRPGEANRDLVGFTMLSCARLLPLEGEEGYRKVLREVGFYTDLKSGEIIEEWRNPYLNETVKVVPIANDPFNHTITNFYPSPPSYGGLNKTAPPKIPLQFDWTRRGDRLNMMSHINLFYPSALQPAKWPRESGQPFSQVTEMFLYQIDWNDMQDRKKTSVEYHGTWGRTTPWLPWMLMGPTPGHCQYHTFMGAVDDINKIDRKTLDYIEKKYPKYLTAPDTWEEPSLSSLEWYSREQKPAPVAAGQPVPRAPDPELPAWFKAMQQAPKSGT